jgi:hypothetical protein
MFQTDVTVEQIQTAIEKVQAARDAVEMLGLHVAARDPLALGMRAASTHMTGAVDSLTTMQEIVRRQAV